MMRSAISAVILCVLLLSLIPPLAHAGTRLTLPECIEIALKNQPAVKAADQNLNAARSQVIQAASPYYPQVKVSTGYSVDRSRSAFWPGISTGLTATASISQQVSTRSYTTTLSASQLIYDFGRTGNTLDAARGGERSADLDRQKIVQEAILNVQQSYYGLLKSNKLLSVAGQNLGQAEAHLKQAEAFYRAGTRPRFDVTRTEVEVNNARLGVINARNGVRISRIGLNNAMGIEQGADLEIEDIPLVRNPVPALDETQREALQNRPELRKAEEGIGIAEARLRSERALHFPNIAAAGSYSWSDGVSTTGSFSADLGSSWNAGITLNLSLFEGGLTRGRVAEARANLLALEAQRDTLKQTVLLEVNQAYADLDNAVARLEVTESNQRKAKENLDIAQGRYQAGVGPYIEVTDARVAELSAEVDHVQAQYDYQLAVAKLEKAMGRTEFQNPK